MTYTKERIPIGTVIFTMLILASVSGMLFNAAKYTQVLLEIKNNIHTAQSLVLQNLDLIGYTTWFVPVNIILFYIYGVYLSKRSLVDKQLLVKIIPVPMITALMYIVSVCAILYLGAVFVDTFNLLIFIVVYSIISLVLITLVNTVSLYLLLRQVRQKSRLLSKKEDVLTEGAVEDILKQHAASTSQSAVFSIVILLMLLLTAVSVLSIPFLVILGFKVGVQVYIGIVMFAGTIYGIVRWVKDIINMLDEEETDVHGR